MGRWLLIIAVVSFLLVAWGAVVAFIYTAPLQWARMWRARVQAFDLRIRVAAVTKLTKPKYLVKVAVNEEKKAWHHSDVFGAALDRLQELGADESLAEIAIALGHAPGENAVSRIRNRIWLAHVADSAPCPMVRKEAKRLLAEHGRM